MNAPAFAPRAAWAPPVTAADPIAGIALAAIVDGLEQGIVVTDAAGRALLLNAAARRLLARGALRLYDGVLRAPGARDASALRRMIASCASGEARARSARLTGPGDGEVLLAVASPLTAPAARGLDLVVVLLVDPEGAAVPDPALVREQFDLTGAEAAVAMEILKGDGLPACAARLGTRLSTARTHLQRVFEKTGTSRQAELVRLLLLCRHPVTGDRGPRVRRALTS